MAFDERSNVAHRLLQRLGPWHCSVKRWASKIPTEPALVWLNGQAEVVAKKTYRELDSEATKLAVKLRSVYGCKPGDRLILCYPPGVDFVVAFVACQMLGAVAVPLYFPMQTHRSKNVHSLLSLVRKARASQYLLTSSACKDYLLTDWDMENRDGPRLHWLFSDELIREPDGADGARSKYSIIFSIYTDAAPTDIAFMQFSSGSTGNPKGCLITQAGFLHNIHHNWHMSGIYCSTRNKSIYDVPLEEYADFTEDFHNLAVQRWGHRIRFLSWLPVTHDMGLVGMLGVPLFFGCTAYFMSPLDFLRTPSVWLEAFSRHQCSITAAPDFAYALATRKVSDAVLQRLSFRKALAFINGAEPIRQRTLELFASKFGDCGFEPWMMCPAYGLAENTVGVTGRGHDGVWPRTPRILKVNRDKLFPGDIVCPIRSTEPSNDISTYKNIVGCGCPHGEVVVKIVHPETLEELPAWHVGEVWVSSPSCALAYFDDPAATAVTFEGQVTGVSQTENGTLKYLRTGDLGFTGDGELYITGRLKNILIIRGQNYYLQDFEEVVENCFHIRKGCAMAFAVSGDEDCPESLGVAAEVERSVTLLAELQAIAEQVRRSVSQVFQLPVHSLWLTEAGTLPKTTSGKPRRHAARVMLEKASCKGVLYCSAPRQPDNAPGRPLQQHTQCCRNSVSPEESVAKEVETGEHSASLPYVQSVDADTRQITSDASMYCSEGDSERQNFCLKAIASVETVVFECFKEVFGRFDLPMDNNTPLGAFHVDSLSAVELAAALRRNLDVEVEPFAFFDCPDIGSVVRTVKDVLLYENKANRPRAPQPLDNLKHETEYEIYITGMACKLPRGCDDPATFWARLLQRDHFIGVPPPGRYPRLCSHHATCTTLKREDQFQNWQGGFIDDISLFDNNYFGISAAEAAAMDPQQRLLLMQAVEALSARGDSISAARQTGVFVGCCSEDWQRLNYAERSQAFTVTAQSSCMLANRISYSLNFTGPSVTIDTACSSSLVALHCAWQEMTTRGTRCCNSVDTAIVAAVNLTLVFETTLALQRSGFLSPSYRCRTFDASADGFVRSEGAGAVVLEKIRRAACETASTGSAVPQDDADHRVKPFAKSSVGGNKSVLSPTPTASNGSRVNRDNRYLAQQTENDEGTTPTGSASLSATCTEEVHSAAPDPLEQGGQGSTTPTTSRTTLKTPRKAWCRLVATAVVHGGKTASVTAPCRASQEQLCRRTLSLAGVTPDEICYIETHGTGTALGDPIEVAAIVNVFRSDSSSRSSPLILGAVKTNLGHLEGAAGMAGLLKCALCLAHDEVPANLHLRTLNPYIDFQQLAVVLPCKTIPLTITSNSANDKENQCNIMEPTNRNMFGCAKLASRSSTTDTRRRLEGSNCIVTSLGFGGTYAQAVLQSVPSNDPLADVQSTSQEAPARRTWNLKRFDHRIPLLPPASPAVFPACLWRVAWKLLAIDDSQERNYSISWRAGSNRKSPWLVLSFRESSGAYWKTLGLRDADAVVQTVSADVSEESLQYLLQSRAWQAILFVDGVQVCDVATAVQIFLLSLRVIPLCGKLLSKIHPYCKMLLLTRGSQLVQKHTSLSFIHIEDTPPHAAGMLGFTRACRAELNYSTGRSPPLYFIDLDPATALNSSLNALAAIVQNLTEDELDVAIRQGKVYVPRLWFAGPLPCDTVRAQEENSTEVEIRNAVRFPLHVEETAVRKRSKSTCSVSRMSNRPKVNEKNLGLDGQHASSCGEGLASWACRVRLMSVCTDSIRYSVDGQAESSDVLVGCSGIVVAVGNQVEHIRVGDAVCGFAPSLFKKKPNAIITTCSHLLQPIPHSFSFECAAAMPTQLAQIMHAASLGAQHYRKSSSTTSSIDIAQNGSTLDTKQGSQKALVNTLCTAKNCSSDESSTNRCLLEQKLADRASESICNAGSGFQLHGRAVCSKMKPGEVAAYGCSREATSMLQSSMHPCVSDGGRRNNGEECARQKPVSKDKETYQPPHMETPDSWTPCTQVADSDVTSSKETTRSHIHCPIDLVIVDGSGAGLTAAIYFRNKGYDVIGIPVSKDQQQALEALNIRVFGAAEAAVGQDEDDTTPSVRLTAVKIPGVESEAGLPESSGGISVRTGRRAARTTAPGGFALGALQQTLWSADAGAAQQDAAVAAGARPDETIVSGGPTAAEQVLDAGVSESGPLQSSEESAAEYLNQQESCLLKQSEFTAPTDIHACWPSNRVFYCTIRSQESVKRLLPWVSEESMIYDFSFSSAPGQAKKWFRSQSNGIAYWNGAVWDPAKDASSEVLSLDDALRGACDLLNEGLPCHSLVELHVFLDAALDEEAAFQEACDFTDEGTHAGNVVCTYSNPILHVPSVFVSSPASSNREIFYSPPAIPMEGICSNGKGGTGTPRKPGKISLHKGVTAMKGREVCGQQHSKFSIDSGSPDRRQKGFLVTAGSMGENMFVSAEQRRNASYIVSGGPGALSAGVARWLVEEGALYVVLLHEEKLQEQTEEDSDWKWLQQTNTVARTVTLTCSLQSKESIQNAMRRIREELHFPPLRGLIHVPSDVLPELTGNGENAVDGGRFVLEHKALAAWNLHYALDELHMEDTLQLFVLFSGISGLVGSIKREAACAANTTLDMLACYRSSQGLSGLSIQWASWLAETTQVAFSQSRAAALACESEPLLSAWLNKAGITGVPDGLRTLRQILTLYISGHTGAVVACFGADPVLLEAALTGDGGWIPKPAASLNKQRMQTPADTGCPFLATSAAPAAVKGGGICTEYHDVLYELVYKEVYALVGFYVTLENGQKLSDDETLSSLGMDSLTAAELKYELQSRFRVDFETHIMQQQATVETIASSIFSHFCSQLCLSFSDGPDSIKSSKARDSIAVVSMALRLPGGCCCPSTLWGMLLAGTDCSRDICTFGKPTKHDFRSTHTQKMLSSRIEATRACYLDGADMFDSDFFGLSLPEAIDLDRQARLLLEVAYEALFNINIHDAVPHSGLPVAVYATGSAPCEHPVVAQEGEPFNRVLQPPGYRSACDSLQRSFTSFAKLDSAPTLSRSQESLPGLISYLLSLSGMSVSVSAGGASSLSALCLAADHLGSNTDAEAALVGAVRLLPVKLSNASVSVDYSRRAEVSVPGSWCGRVSTDDSFAFDHIQGEGAIAVVLQRQRLAETSANPVLAIIRGRSMTHTGRRGTATKGEGGSCTAAVRSVLEGALASARAKRREVAIVEVAGVGFSTHLHHPEWDAIAQVYGKERSISNKFPVIVSSIKGNVGCLGEAAGLAGFLKVVLMLAQSRPSTGGGCVVIPPSLRLQQICRTMRNIAANGAGGLLFPSKHLVGRPEPAAIASIESRQCSVADGFSVSAEESHVAMETLFSGTERGAQHMEGHGATSSVDNLWHPQEVSSFSARGCFAPTPGVSTSFSPHEQCLWSSVQRAAFRYEPEDRFLGGVTASAPSGFVVHMLIEGGASAMCPTVSITETPPTKNGVQHLPTVVAAAAPAAATGNGADKAASGRSSAGTAVDSAPVPATPRGSVNAVGSRKRCLWLFSDDCTNLLYCGRPLYFTSKIFAQELDGCSKLMRRHLPTSLRRLLYPTCEAELLASEKFLRLPHVATLSLFALQWSLSSYLRQTAQGRSIAVSGVGVGEAVAAAVAGLLSLGEAIELVIALGSTTQSHTHTNDAQTSTTLFGEKAPSAQADTRLFFMPSSFSQSHTGTSVDYGLSTDGEQTNRSDCFSLYDGTDASCRSLYWKNDIYPTNRSGRQRTQHEQSGFSFASSSLEKAEQSEQSQHQLRPSHPFAIHVSALPAAMSKDDDDGRSFFHMQAAAVETPRCSPAAGGMHQEMFKEKSSVVADTAVSTPVALSRSPALQATAVEAVTCSTITQTLNGQDGMPRTSSASANNAVCSRAFAETAVSLPEHAVVRTNGREASAEVELEVPKLRLCGNALVQEKRRGSCCLPESRLTTLPSSIAGGNKVGDSRALSPPTTLHRRAGSLVDLKVTDTPQHNAPPFCSIPSSFPSSSSSSSLSELLTDTLPQRQASVDEIFWSTDRREGEPLRGDRRRRSRINNVALPPLPQAFTPTPRERRNSLQYVTPTHAKISSQAFKTARFVSSDNLTGDRRVSYFGEQCGRQPDGDTASLSVIPGRVSDEAVLQENKGCNAALGGRTPLRSPSISHLVGGADTTPASSSLHHTVSERGQPLASSYEKKGAHARSFPTSNAGMEGLSKGKPRCLQCEEIRSIVSNISVKQATCVFLSAALGAAAPDRLLRDPLYWYATSPQKLRLRTIVKVAKKVLRTAAVVLIGPPAVGPLNPATLVKLAKHVEILCFTGRSDSLEAVIPCEVSTSIERAATVCTDVVLRVPHATPCWKHINTQPLGPCKMHGVRFPSLSAGVPRQSITRRTVQGHRRDSLAHTRATLSE